MSDPLLTTEQYARLLEYAQAIDTFPQSQRIAKRGIKARNSSLKAQKQWRTSSTERRALNRVMKSHQAEPRMYTTYSEGW